VINFDKSQTDGFAVAIKPAKAPAESRLPPTVVPWIPISSFVADGDGKAVGLGPQGIDAKRAGRETDAQRRIRRTPLKPAPYSTLRPT
jgi:hypothetical protein